MKNIKTYTQFVNENLLRKAISHTASLVGIDTIKSELSDLIKKYSSYLDEVYQYYLKRKKSNDINVNNLMVVKDIELRLNIAKSDEEKQECLKSLSDLKNETMADYHVKLDELKTLKLGSDIDAMNFASEELAALKQRLAYIDNLLKVDMDATNESLIASNDFDSTKVTPYVEWTLEDKHDITEMVKPRTLSSFEDKAKTIIDNSSRSVDIWMKNKADLYTKWDNIYDIDVLKQKETQKKIY